MAYQLPDILRPTIKRDGVKNGENYALWNTPNLTAEQFHGLQPIDRLVYLALLGSLAPSTHNSQPWAFKVDPSQNNIQIHLDRDRVLPASDAKGRQSCVSVGCAIGSIQTTAESYGLIPKLTLADIDQERVKPYDFSPNTTRYIPLATLTLPNRPAPHLDDVSIREAVFSRRMDRGEFESSKPIPSSGIDKIKEDTKILKIGLSLFIRGGLSGGIINMLSEAQYVADNYVANSPKFARELGDWFLPNDTSAYVGMPGDTFKQEGASAADIHDQLIGNKTLRSQSIYGFANTGKLGIQSSPLMGLLTTKEDSPEFWIKGGIALNQIAYTLEKSNVRMAIHAGLAEVADMALEVLPAKYLKQTPIVLFRAGYSSEALKPHSPRLPITEILLS